MNANWRMVQPEHYQTACARLASAQTREAKKWNVLHEGRRVPAKEVAKLAFEIATGEKPAKFSSGDSLARRLKRAGLVVVPDPDASESSPAHG